MIKTILSSEITYIIIDIVLGSLMAFLGILSYGKTRNISGLFFVLSSIFMYLSMIFRVLEMLNIFIIRDITYQKLPVYFFLLNDLILIFMILGFIFVLLEKK